MQIYPINNFNNLNFGSCLKANQKPNSFASFLEAWVPNLSQLDLMPRYREFYCAPVSAANILVSKAENGFPNLNRLNPTALIQDLGRYFKTGICYDENAGTTSQNLISGLEKYVTDKGYGINISYSEIRPVNSKYKQNLMLDLSTLTSDLQAKKGVILNIGFYRKNTHNGQTRYERLQGHFISAHRFDQGAGLLICDPYLKGDNTKYINLSKINEGVLIHDRGKEAILTSSANSFYEIKERFPYNDTNIASILEGVISFELVK